ncbi:riboflavin synthase, partial [bacterium]|nr:riboflavin synthase [bacterium]
SAELTHGESVAVNGACLTVLEVNEGFFRADAVADTLAATTLGRLRGGARVNIERALRLGDRMGGHMVTGHVDGVTKVTARRDLATGSEITFRLPDELARYVVAKGSVAIDGTSVTVAAVAARVFRVALIPETLKATLAGTYAVGTSVNIETDILAKHVARLLEGGATPAGHRSTASGEHTDEDGEKSALTIERLRELGF